MRAQAGIGGDSDGRSGEPDEELNKSIASSDAFEAIELFKPSSSSPDRELWRLAEHHIDSSSMLTETITMYYIGIVVSDSILVLVCNCYRILRIINKYCTFSIEIDVTLTLTNVGSPPLALPWYLVWLVPAIALYYQYYFTFIGNQEGAPPSFSRKLVL